MRRLGLTLQRTGGRLKLAKKLIVECAGVIEDLPVTLGELIIPMTFTVLTEATYPVIIGNPTLEELYYLICSRTQLFSLIYNAEEVEIPIEYYKEATQEAEGNEGEFSTEEEEEFSSEEEDSSDEEAADIVMAAGQLKTMWKPY